MGPDDAAGVYFVAMTDWLHTIPYISKKGIILQEHSNFTGETVFRHAVFRSRTLTRGKTKLSDIPHCAGPRLPLTISHKK